MILISRKNIVMLAGLIVFCFVTACHFSDRKAVVKDAIKSMIGKKMQLTQDSICENVSSKIIILGKDTGDCSTCSMHVYDWYVYNLDLQNRKLSCDIIYILNDSSQLNSEVKALLGYYKLYYVAGVSNFLSENDFIKKDMFQVFLIDSNNIIKVVGSPIGKPELWNLYKREIQKMHSISEK